ncbi:MAG: helix-turn-helix domain-containing protein [Candidatus Thorarchaeota archaeon]|nr:helix-turn-helix domain-containing protein [Candidatus Thorarchaeota archaeon]
MSKEGPGELDKVFKALGNVTRRRILQLLAQDARYPYELSKVLGSNYRGILKHLDALQEAGLVERFHGESDLGPDRVYYRLNARFGLSTTILPDVFTVRLTRREKTSRILVPKGFIIPEARPDVTAVKRLLSELGKVNKRLVNIDEERMRFTSLRGKIIRKIEEIMDQSAWDEESCQKVRALIDPIRQQTSDPQEDPRDIWTETVKQTIRLFESLFETHGNIITKKSQDDTEEDEDEEFVVSPD